MNLAVHTKSFKAVAFVILIPLTILLSCKKDKDEDPTPSQNESFTSLNQYFESKSPKSVVFTAKGETKSFFLSDNGTQISIPANTFVDATGQPVKGDIEMKLKEVFSNSDMIHSGVFPISNGSILNSGGEFYIQASKDGKNLLVKDGAFINVNIPAQAVDQNMELFFGGPFEEQEDTIPLNWIPANDTMIIGNNRSNSSFTFNSVDNSYEISLDSLGWGNIDAFNNSVQYFECVFNLTGIQGLDNTNTSAFAVFKDENAVWPVGLKSYGYGYISNNTINENHLADIPLNLLVISVVNTQLYYGLLDITPQQGSTYTIQMKKTTSANLDLVIENLQ